MVPRRLALFLLLALLCVIGVGFAPRGTAPFSVVYGPASAFRAQRAFLLLTFAVLAALKLFQVFCSRIFFGRSHFLSALAAYSVTSEFAPLTGVFRC